MAKENPLTAGSVIAEMFQPGSYKRNQGRNVRLVTAVTLGVIFALSAWRLHDTLSIGSLSGLQWLLPAIVLFGGLWISYRVINLPQFADFLIAVEAEMSKVSWPTRTELIRSSMVVIFLIFALAGVLFLFDMFWQWVFRMLNILN